VGPLHKSKKPPEGLGGHESRFPIVSEGPLQLPVRHAVFPLPPAQGIPVRCCHHEATPRCHELPCPGQLRSRIREGPTLRQAPRYHGMEWSAGRRSEGGIRDGRPFHDLEPALPQEGAQVWSAASKQNGTSTPGGHGSSELPEWSVGALRRLLHALVGPEGVQKPTRYEARARRGSASGHVGSPER